MREPTTVLVFGGSGLIGRPVVQELVDRGYDVRIFTRNRIRAAARCPADCQLIEGNLRDAEQLQSAMEGVDAVYISLSNAMRRARPAWDADTEGSKHIMHVAKRVGVQHVLRLSSMGVPEAADDSAWWVPAAKLEADQALLDSGLAFTIFRPTWFMESLPLASLGPHLLALPGSNAPLYWLAGSDYAKQVAEALRRSDARNQIYLCQGPQAHSMREAFRTFARELRRVYIYTPLPRSLLQAMSLVSEQMQYLCKLLDMTEQYVAKIDKDVNGNDLYRPHTTVEQFACTLRHTTDWPQKSMA